MIYPTIPSFLQARKASHTKSLFKGSANSCIMGLNNLIPNIIMKAHILSEDYLVDPEKPLPLRPRNPGQVFQRRESARNRLQQPIPGREKESSEQLSQVVSRSGEDGVGFIALFSLEVVAIHSVVGF